MQMRNIFYTILILLIWISVCTAETNRQSYINWLQKNHAWEILNNKLDSLSPTPENVLTRANYLMRMHKFDNSLKILDKYGKFSNNALESKRLFLKAKINRQQRKHFLALQNYFSAAKVISPQEYSEELKNHTDVKWYCKTVGKKYFWENYCGGPANKNLDMWFLNALRLAPDILPENQFWQNLNQLLIQNNAKVDSPTQSTENCLSISQATRNNTVQSLLASAMGDMGKGRDLLLSVESDEVRYMWSEIFSRVFDQNFELNMDKNKDKLDLKGLYPKYRAFEDYIYPLLDKQSAKDWMLKQPRTSSWINFRSDISSLDNKKKALDKIRKELNSTFLNPKLEKVLQKYAFGYAVLADKYSLAQQLWENIESENKCFSLQVAGFVLGFSSSLSQNKKVNRFPNFNQLAIIVKNSLYTASVCKLITPFWIKEFKGKYSKVATNFPLDFLANYSLHKQKWSKKHSVQLGKTITLLYPFSLLKNRACMWLAKRAHKNKQVDKAWGYLGELDDSIQNSKKKRDSYKKPRIIISVWPGDIRRKICGLLLPCTGLL